MKADQQDKPADAVLSPAAARQRGMASVEFALVGTLLFTLLFGMAEVGRALFVWNILEEVTRRGARLAAVCPVTEPATRVQQLATLNGQVLPKLTPANVQIQYLDANGVPIAAPASNISDIAFVRAQISNFQHQLLIPFVSRAAINVPALATTLPSESLGLTPNGTWGVQC